VEYSLPPHTEGKSITIIVTSSCLKESLSPTIQSDKMVHMSNGFLINPVAFVSFHLWEYIKMKFKLLQHQRTSQSGRVLTCDVNSFVG
jgi:hypothetical protein